MKTRLTTSIVSTGVALAVLTGCVSSKKYKASQADLSKVRNDSAQLAQQVSSLNGNVHDLQDKNTSLQRSLDSSSSRYATQEKSLDYYQNYFKEQQNNLSQVSDDVKGALTQAGIANGDVQQTNNTIYVQFDENELFKKNSTMVTPVGKKVLDGLVTVFKNRSNVDVAVGSGDSTTGWVATENMPASDAMMSTAPKHHKVKHASHKSTSATAGGAQGSGSGSGSVAANTSGSGAKSNVSPTHRKKQHKYSSEGSMAISNMGNMHNRAWALKQGRMVTVANHFLKSGAPKINVQLQQPPMNGAPQSNAIKVIITPKMDNFKPENPSAVGAR